MQTDTIQISGIPDAVIKAISQRAYEVGTTPEDYVRHLIEEDVSSGLTMRALFATVRDDIKASGISGDELTTLLEDAREKAHEERYGK